MSNAEPSPGARGHGGWRRAVAIVALLSGFALAYYNSAGTTEVQLSLLLTHVISGPVDDGMGRSRLRRVNVLVPRKQGSDEVGWAHTVEFTAGGAPEATQPLTVTIPRGLREVKVRCSFALRGASTWHDSIGVASIDPDRDDLQVVDVGSCRPR